MDVEVWASVAAWLGALVGIASAVYGGLQARVARHALREAKAAREAAEDQAHSARDSASSAFRSAEAAIWQARTAEAQLRVAEQEQIRADAPEFTVQTDPPVDGSARVTVRMDKGVPGLVVTFKWYSEAIGTWEGVELATHSMGDLGCPDVMFPGKTYTFLASIPDDPEHYGRGSIRVEMQCAEPDGDRTWTYGKVADWRLPS